MKRLLLISLSFNVLIILFIAGKRYYYSHPPAYVAAQINSYDTLNDMRNSLLSSLPIDSTDIVFVGTSITEGFPVTEIFGQHVKNRGIAGNRTYHLLDRITPIAMMHPKKIFIEAGVNDLRDGVSADSVFKNYIKIIDIIRATSPKTLICVQSVFPTTWGYEEINDHIVQLNNILIDYCTAFGLKYIDVHAALMQDGKLDSQFTGDGLHLNGKGYKLWQSAVEKYVK
jgi:lysophospholipase L1-like esterase